MGTSHSAVGADHTLNSLESHSWEGGQSGPYIQHHNSNLAAPPLLVGDSLLVSGTFLMVKVILVVTESIAEGRGVKSGGGARIEVGG